MPQIINSTFAWIYSAHKLNGVQLDQFNATENQLSFWVYFTTHKVTEQIYAIAQQLYLRVYSTRLKGEET